MKAAHRVSVTALLALLTSFAIACSSTDDAGPQSTPTASLSDDPTERPDNSTTGGNAVCDVNSTYDANPRSPCSFASGDCRYNSKSGDWSHGYHKGECGPNDWLVGVSAYTSGVSAHGFRCAAAKYSGTVTRTNVAFPTSDNRRTTATGDWDPGYVKGECGTYEYVAGISIGPHDGGKVRSILCASFSNEPPNTGCAAVAFGNVDARESTISGDWDWGSFKGECGIGRHMAGLSHDASGRPHAMLCCDSADPVEPAYHCCSVAAYTASHALCESDPSTYDVECQTVGYCCDSANSKSSPLVGSSYCADVAQGTGSNAATIEPDPYGLSPSASGSTATGATCGSSPGSWSFSKIQSQKMGNTYFGAGYEGDIAFSATGAPVDADASAGLRVWASLLGHSIPLANVATGADLAVPDVHASVSVLGAQLWGIDATTGSYSADKSFKQTVFSQSDVVIVFGMPVTVTAAVYAELGIKTSAALGSTGLTFGATPFAAATATVSAAVGLKRGRFELDVALEGTLLLMNASIPTTATISPAAGHVSYDLQSSLALQTLSGNVAIALHAKLKPFYHKTHHHTLASWNGLSATTPLLSAHGCSNL